MPTGLELPTNVLLTLLITIPGLNPSDGQKVHTGTSECHGTMNYRVFKCDIPMMSHHGNGQLAWLVFTTELEVNCVSHSAMHKSSGRVAIDTQVVAYLATRSFF